MRRIVVVIVLALVGAATAGILIANGGVAVNSTQISANQLRGELRAIATTPDYSCYLGATIDLGTVGTASFFSTTGSANWTQTRVDGLAIEDYMVQHYAWSPTADETASARTTYIEGLTIGAQRAGRQCGVSAATALDEMPGWFIDSQVRATAASLALVAKLPGAQPLDEASLQAHFHAQPSNYDTICISVAFVQSAYGPAFAADQKAGMSVANLARKYSVDPSGQNGGAYGCYAPGTANYATVRQLTLGQPLNKFPTQPREQATSQGTMLLYITPTSRSANSYETARSQVQADLREYNSSLGASAENEIVRLAAVAVDPAFATWSTSQQKVLPLTPPPAALTGVTAANGA